MGAPVSEPYSRLYHRFAEEFHDVYADDQALSTWIRLLLLADASWPMRPPLPRSVRARVLRTLITAGLVIFDGDTYTIRGLDAERTRRRDAAVRAAGKRWQGTGNADSYADAHAGAYADAHASAMPRRDETSTRRDEREIPPPPAERGRRKNGTNPRANGSAPRDDRSNPRAMGTSIRQVRVDQKRGPTALGDLLRVAMGNGNGPVLVDDEDLV